MIHIRHKLWVADEGQDIAEYAVAGGHPGNCPGHDSPRRLERKQRIFKRCEFNSVTRPIVLPGSKRGRGNRIGVRLPRALPFF
jgi:hypothetical protein